MLFSDVGNFYAACMGPHNEAWQISNPKEIAWQVDEILSKPGEPSGRLEMRNLVYEDVEFLARTDMLSAARSLRPGTMQITYNAQDIDWHMIRARSLYDHFQPILHLPEYKLVGSQLEYAIDAAVCLDIQMTIAQAHVVKIVCLYSVAAGLDKARAQGIAIGSIIVRPGGSAASGSCRVRQKSKFDKNRRLESGCRSFAGRRLARDRAYTFVTGDCLVRKIFRRCRLGDRILRLVLRP